MDHRQDNEVGMAMRSHGKKTAETAHCRKHPQRLSQCLTGSWDLTRGILWRTGHFRGLSEASRESNYYSSESGRHCSVTLLHSNVNIFINYFSLQTTHLVNRLLQPACEEAAALKFLCTRQSSCQLCEHSSFVGAARGSPHLSSPPRSSPL